MPKVPSVGGQGRCFRRPTSPTAGWIPRTRASVSPPPRKNRPPRHALHPPPAEEMRMDRGAKEEGDTNLDRRGPGSTGGEVGSDPAEKAGAEVHPPPARSGLEPSQLPKLARRGNPPSKAGGRGLPHGRRRSEPCAHRTGEAASWLLRRRWSSRLVAAVVLSLVTSWWWAATPGAGARRSGRVRRSPRWCEPHAASPPDPGPKLTEGAVTMVPTGIRAHRSCLVLLLRWIGRREKQSHDKAFERNREHESKSHGIFLQQFLHLDPCTFMINHL
jgi:hypothetical protein